MNEWTETLLKYNLFQGIGKYELEEMLGCLKPRVVNYQKNEIVSLSGDDFNVFGLVLSGNISISKENAAGDRIIIDILKAGQIFGEIAAFDGNKVWPATVTTQTCCNIMFMTPDIILGTCKKQCASHRNLIRNMLKIVSRKAILLNQKVEYLLMKSIRQRLSNYLLAQYKNKGQPTFIIPMNRNELADFLNVTRPSLSREMCKMRDEGVIEFYRESVKIINEGQLKEMAR